MGRQRLITLTQAIVLRSLLGNAVTETPDLDNAAIPHPQPVLQQQQ
jgi:hypothetical protein